MKQKHFLERNNNNRMHSEGAIPLAKSEAKKNFFVLFLLFFPLRHLFRLRSRSLVYSMNGFQSNFNDS